MLHTREELLVSPILVQTEMQTIDSLSFLVRTAFDYRELDHNRVELCEIVYGK